MLRTLGAEGLDNGERPVRYIEVDHDRVDEVIGTILAAYEAGGFPYNQDTVRLPHDPRHMPETLERGGREHALFLWASCYYMRGGIKSVDAFRSLSTYI